MKSSSLLNSTRVSPIEQTQLLKYGGESKQRAKPEMHLALPLTSLIDAFSIIVIYLLIGTQSTGIEMNLPGKIQLPQATQAAGLEKESPAVVRIVKGQYFINENQVAASRLGETLAQLRKEMTDETAEILVQADQQMDYADLDPLLRAGSEAGIQKLKFAVLPNK